MSSAISMSHSLISNQQDSSLNSTLLHIYPLKLGSGIINRLPGERKPWKVACAISVMYIYFRLADCKDGCVEQPTPGMLTVLRACTKQLQQALLVLHTANTKHSDFTVDITQMFNV